MAQHRVDVNEANHSNIHSAGRDIVFNESGAVPEGQWGQVLGWMYEDIQVVRSCSLRWRTVQAVAYTALIIATVALFLSGITLVRVF